MGKITYIKRYYKGRELDEDEISIKVVDKGDMVTVEDYDGEIEIEKSKVKILIYGSFIVDVYDVYFVDASNDYDCIGIHLAVGIEGYDNARRYAKKGQKALSHKYLENVLIVGHSVTDRDYVLKCNI